MINKNIVSEALQHTWPWYKTQTIPPVKPVNGQDKEISLLIHDIFGGEILKTPKKGSWHFYNRINGERFDFSHSSTDHGFIASHFDDIPSTPEEAYQYFDQTDYSSFYMKFILAFEELAGIQFHRTDYSS